MGLDGAGCAKMGPDVQKCPRMRKNAPRASLGAPVLSWGPWVPKRAQKTTHGGKGAPPWARALWILCGLYCMAEYIGQRMWQGASRVGTPVGASDAGRVKRVWRSPTKSSPGSPMNLDDAYDMYGT